MKSSENAPPLNDAQQHDDDSNHEEDVDESTNRVTGNQTQQPKDDKNERNDG